MGVWYMVYLSKTVTLKNSARCPIQCQLLEGSLTMVPALKELTEYLRSLDKQESPHAGPRAQASGAGGHCEGG